MACLNSTLLHEARPRTTSGSEKVVYVIVAAFIALLVLGAIVQSVS
jgi:hypothetical protein